MKILFVSNLYPPNVLGGYEELCSEVASRLSERGYEVSVLTSSYGAKLADNSNPRMKVRQGLRLVVGQSVYQPFAGRNDRRNMRNIQNAEALRSAVDDFAPDVIFCWNLFGLDRPFFEALQTLRLPIVAMLTDNWLAGMLNSSFVGAYHEECVLGARAPTDWPSNGGLRLQLPQNVSAIFGSNFMRDFYYASGVIISNGAVIHNGVNMQLNYHKRAPESRTIDSEVRLLFAGRVVEMKGVSTAVRALSKLIRERPNIDWKLSIVGDMKDTQYIEGLMALAKAEGCAHAIDLRNRVPPEDLPQLFNSHDIYVFPSLYEPFSLTLIHALESGIPSVVSSTGGNLEIVKDGDTGLLFQKGDPNDMARSILRLVGDPALRQHVSKRAAAIASQFSTAEMIERMDAHLLSARRAYFDR
ncbi:glycosyltransferase [Ensifer adhaerens OV14]|nr:glycosyltransferase [Ensifer adhaerens OV14]